MLTKSLPVPAIMLFYICENTGNHCVSVRLSFEQKMFQFMLNKNIFLNCSHSFSGHFTLIGFMIVCGCVFNVVTGCTLH